MQPLNHVLLQLTTQQMFNRQAVALFPPVDDGIRQQSLNCLSEDILGRHAVQLPGPGQRGQKFHQHMIQQGNPNLQRGCHGHSVHLHQDAVGHHKTHVKIDLPVDLVIGITPAV